MNNGVAIMYAFNQKVTADGRRRVDLIDRYGHIIRDAYIMSGAGFPLNVPLQQETAPQDYTNFPRVVVGFMQGETRPIVLGSLDNRDVSYTPETDTNTHYDEEAFGGPKLTDEADVDVEENIASLEEVVLAAPDGGRLILKRNGYAVLAGIGVSVQLPTGSYMRVSAGGDTTGRIPLVEPLLNIIDQMAAKINDLQEEVAALQATLSGPFSMNLLGLTVTPTGLVAVAPGILPAVATIEAITPSVPEPLLPVDALTVSSATLRVSSATEG